MSDLKQEIDTYNRHLPTLLRQQGKFVLIKSTEIAGIFDSYLEALTAGYQRFKLDSFLVKQITPAQPVAYFSRIGTIRAEILHSRAPKRSWQALHWILDSDGVQRCTGDAAALPQRVCTGGGRPERGIRYRLGSSAQQRGQQRVRNKCLHVRRAHDGRAGIRWRLGLGLGLGFRLGALFWPGIRRRFWVWRRHRHRLLRQRRRSVWIGLCRRRAGLAIARANFRTAATAARDR